jgi:hypothetical protein
MGLWSDGGRSSGQSAPQFAAGFADITGVSVEMQSPGAVDAAAGSRYIEVPVAITATRRDGSQHRLTGTYTLRRAVGMARPRNSGSGASARRTCAKRSKRHVRDTTMDATPRIVLDTNVCLDLFVFDDPRCRRLLDALHAGDVIAVTSASCREEWLRVLCYPQLALDGAAREAATARFDALIQCCPPWLDRRGRRGEATALQRSGRPEIPRPGAARRCPLAAQPR